MVKVIYAPTVHLISRPEFIEPPSLNVDWKGESTGGERLVEFGGRICYMSQHNPADRTTAEYIANVKEQRHFSVTEHANYSLLVEGVSRSLSHEAVRHRHMSPSQLSQRYVDAKDTAFVIPPAFIGNAVLEQHFAADMEEASRQYQGYVNALTIQYRELPDKRARIKKAREAARCVLPNATETKFVLTGNVRGWRHFLNLRGSVHADKEIHRLTFMIHAVLCEESQAFFGDYSVDSEGSLVPAFTEV